MWGFLGEFWNAITQTTIDAWVYTTTWFQNVGLAVAGAIGALFEWLLHYINDIVLFFGWIAGIAKTFFLTLILPITYLYNFIASFLGSATQPPISIESALNVYSTTTMQVFNTIPYWTTIQSILGFGVLIAGAGGIIWLLTML